MFKKVLIGIGVLLVIGVVATLASPDGRKGFSEGVKKAEQQVSSEAAASSPKPTVAPTEEPTVAPTPEPPSYDPQAVEFVSHLQESSSDISDRLMAFSSIDVSDYAAFGAAGQDLSDTAQDELDWLDEHPASDCYASEYKSYRGIIRSLKRAGDLIVDGIDELDVSKITQASTELTDSTATLSDLTPKMLGLAEECKQ